MYRNFFAALAVTLGLIGVRTAEAVPLNIDFTSNAAGPTQLGFSAFQHGSNNSQTLTEGSFAYANDELAGIGNSVTVSVMGSFWRVRNAVTGTFAAQNALLRDNVLMVAAAGSQTITLTLEGLKPGIFAMTTYHHDTQFGGGNAELEFLLTDGQGTGQSIATGIPTTGSTTPSAISTHNFQFTVLNTSPVVLELVGSNFNVSPDPADVAAFNGFELQFVSELPPVPEPASGFMLGCGALILILRLRKR